MIPRTISTRMMSSPAGKSRKKVDCAVYGCGLSASGALAIPKLVQSTENSNSELSAKETKYAKRVPFFNTAGIRHITSGFGFSLFASENRLWGAGINNRFQIGGQLSSASKFQDYYISAKKIALPSDDLSLKILEISSGRAHSLILTSAGVFAIGDNNSGQCGLDPARFPHSVGLPDLPLRPLPISLELSIVSVHCSMDSSFLVDSNGNVHSFGLNEDGQCGNGRYGVEWTPKRVIGDVTGVRIGRISGSTDTIMATEVAAADSGEKGGEVFIWGQTEYGQAAGASDEIQLNTSRCLNLSQSIGPIVSADATSSSIIAQNQRGEVFVWGVGVLGMGPDADRLTRPTRMDQPLFDGKEVTRISAGNSAMSAINSAGRLFVWGENRFSSLGLNHSKRQLFPYQLFVPGDVKTAALGPDHSLFLVH